MTFSRDRIENMGEESTDCQELFRQELQEMFRRGHHMAENHGARFEQGVFLYVNEDLRILYLKLEMAIEFWVGAAPMAKSQYMDGQWMSQRSWLLPHLVPGAVQILRDAMVLDDLASI